MLLDDGLTFEWMAAANSATVEDLAGAHPRLMKSFGKLDPIPTAAIFAGLLTAPSLQANCLRIEALVHLAMAYGAGSARPSPSFVRRGFDVLGKGPCGRMEDPAEDVFVSLVGTSEGNFRIFDGAWEGGAFYLQRVLDIVDGMPRHQPFAGLRASVAALLKVSDAVAERAGIAGNCLGAEVPADVLPESIVGSLSELGASIRFTKEDLFSRGLSVASLSDFVFDTQTVSGLPAQRVGHSDLERRPLVVVGEDVYLLLPTAVRSAIARFVVEWTVSNDRRNTFEQVLAYTYSQLFYNERILGKRLPEPIPFQKMDGGMAASAMIEADPGRFLHLLFFLDGLDGFVEEGLTGVNTRPTALSSAIASSLGRASLLARDNGDFRSGVTLVVMCGLGRGSACELPDEVPANWRIEVVSAHDLATLNWLPDFDALGLWRLLDSRDAIREEGADFLNVNGFSNLVAWARELQGHLVPHGDVPDGFVGKEGRGLIVVRQNALRMLRRDVLDHWMPRRALNPEGRWVRIRKLGESEFAEDGRAPLFGSEEDVCEGHLRAVYLGDTRQWWLEISAPQDAPDRVVYEHWMMACTWLRRAAPVLERAYPEVSAPVVLMSIVFSKIVGNTSGPIRVPDENELRSSVRYEVTEPLRIRIEVSKDFEDGFFQAENIAERVLVEALVGGVARAGGEESDVLKWARVVEEICPNKDARWIPPISGEGL